MTVRDIFVDGDVAYVPLTKGYVAVIDVEDVEKVSGFNWYARKNRNVIYANKTSIHLDGRKSIGIHSVIMGAEKGQIVDHKDGDGLNNRKSNLRFCSIKENSRNQRVSSKSKTGIKGVSWASREGMWRAQIQVDGKTKHIGYFLDIEIAKFAYQQAAIKFFGDFARN